MVRDVRPCQGKARAEARPRKTAQVEPANFPALRDEAGVSDKQLAQTLGVSISRISELTYWCRSTP